MPFATASTICWCVFDAAGKQRRIAALEAETARPEFWADSDAAQRVMRQLAELRAEITPWLDLRARIAEHADLLELALAEDDDALAAELAAEAPALREALERLEFQLQLAGPYDRGNAILAIHARAGGTEAQDWAQMLTRMYTRWAENHRWHAEVVDVSPGEEAGIKSATIEVSGDYVYGYFKGERGVHRLVRLSPFDADHARHTSFALVEVLPEPEDVGEVSIDPNDVRMDVFRASGAGGQNVQKNSTAVRLTHIPTGIVVSCQNERSQLQNREVAMRILQARLLQRELERQQEEQAKLKGEHVSAGWGNQIRSYVLHPYKMVKDLRTGYETSDANGVLEGDLDDIVQAYLKAQVGS